MSSVTSLGMSNGEGGLRRGVDLAKFEEVEVLDKDRLDFDARWPILPDPTEAFVPTRYVPA